jgi:hypothetical protein
MACRTGGNCRPFAASMSMICMSVAPAIAIAEEHITLGARAGDPDRPQASRG